MKNKFTIALLALSALVMTGCNTTHFKVAKADGTSAEIINRRFLWATEAYTATLSTNGASLSASKSNVDSAAIGAVAAGVVEGLAKVKQP